ncbi:MAG: hydroxyacylglutathione hydrolase [Deltaproteobacteria bacterium]|jgi:hydroxyacylglutathione hydrolase|nr:hydroxyacylglutathione hydrolase [Deltaproteobacteria bacterium]MBW2384051.1 hydroxyacylglutathione hydrolase [Deltaproteobacteria bacterium]MBW2698691.1 hydroxyacylglutathione hydrolase [Deltaproteobacteria bacterium]
MALRIERIPTFGDNYTYLVLCEATNEAAIIDAPEVDPVVARVEETGAKVTKILSTHHHPDHSAANPELSRLYEAPVYAHVSDAKRVPGFTHGVDEGDTVSVGEHSARVLFIPSHTMGHIAYVFDDAGAVFSGDMLFAGGCGRLFEGDAQMMYTALCEKLAALPNETKVYCGHEYTEGNLRFAVTIEPDNEAMRERLERVEKIRGRAAANWHDALPDEMTIPSTIGEEKATNPFMRAVDAAELGRIRSAKDNF